MEKITIAIPVYNVEKYVERALYSALNQTYPNIEVLAIDDKGSDNSMDIVRRVQREHPKGNLIRVIEHVHNRGTGATRNTAIDEATGNYLMYLDSDDEITPNCVELHYKAVKEIDADVSVGNHKIIECDLTESVYRERLCENNKIMSSDEVKMYCYPHNLYIPIYPWNKFYKIPFLKEHNVRCIDNHINEDNLLFFQVSINAERVIIFDDVTYFYYKYSNSTMGRLRSGKSCTRSLIQMYEIIEYKNNYRLKQEDDLLDIKIQEDILSQYIYTLDYLKKFCSPEDMAIVKSTYDIIKSLPKNKRVSINCRIKAYVITNYPLPLYLILKRMSHVLGKVIRLLKRRK